MQTKSSKQNILVNNTNKNKQTEEKTAEADVWSISTWMGIHFTKEK